MTSSPQETIDAISHSGLFPMSIAIVNVAEEEEGEEESRLKVCKNISVGVGTSMVMHPYINRCTWLSPWLSPSTTVIGF